MKEIGIIGAGKIVEDSHLPVISTLQSAKVAWVYDQNSVRANDIATAYGIKSITEKDLASAISSISACLLAIPYGVRSDYYELLGDSKVDVYIEKPFAFSLNELQALTGTLDSTNSIIGFQRRYYQSINNLKEIVSNRPFGDLLKIKFYQGFYDLRSGGKGKFHTSVKTAGGGVIAESAIHGLDAMVHIMEPENITLNNIDVIAEKGMDYHASFSSTFDTKNHGEVQVECLISRLRAFGNYFEFEFAGAKVSVGFKPDSTLMVTKNKLQFSIDDVLTTTNYAYSIDDAFYQCWEDFVSPEKPYDIAAQISNQSILVSWIEAIYEKVQE